MSRVSYCCIEFITPRGVDRAPSIFRSKKRHFCALDVGIMFLLNLVT